MNYSTEVNGWYSFSWGHQNHMWWWWCPCQLPCKRKTWKSGHVRLYFLRTILATSFFRGKIGNSTIINSTEQAQNARHNSRNYLQCVSQNSVHASQADLWLVTSYPAPSSLIRLPQNLHMQIVYLYIFVFIYCILCIFSLCLFSSVMFWWRTV